MRSKPSQFLESHRVDSGPLSSDSSYGNNGAFELTYNDVLLVIIASSDGVWDHVSVHTVGRDGSQTPTWDEMDYVRKLFFRGDEWVIQYHAPVNKHIENHPDVLHMWRPQRETIPVPPAWMV